MDTATAPPQQQAPAGNAFGHAWSRLQLPLIAAPIGGAVGVVGAYLYWTIRRVLVRGETMAGDLLNFGFGGVRLYVLILALLAIAHGLLLLLRRLALLAAEGALRGLLLGLLLLDLGRVVLLRHVLLHHLAVVLVCVARSGPSSPVGVAVRGVMCSTRR